LHYRVDKANKNLITYNKGVLTRGITHIFMYPDKNPIANLGPERLILKNAIKMSQMFFLDFCWLGSYLGETTWWGYFTR